MTYLSVVMPFTEHARAVLKPATPKQATTRVPLACHSVEESIPVLTFLGEDTVWMPLAVSAVILPVLNREF